MFKLADKNQVTSSSALWKSPTLENPGACDLLKGYIKEDHGAGWNPGPHACGLHANSLCFNSFSQNREQRTRGSKRESERDRKREREERETESYVAQTGLQLNM